MFFVVADLLDYLRHLMDDETGPGFLEGFNQLRNAPLLILDDLGAQSDVAWVRDRLFQLINHRYAARLPTVFTASRDSLARWSKSGCWRVSTTRASARRCRSPRRPTASTCGTVLALAADACSKCRRSALPGAQIGR